jgi:hypothetical protein
MLKKSSLPANAHMQRPNSEFRYDPTGQARHAEEDDDEKGDELPMGQFWHVAEEFAPTTAENVEAGQP